MRLIDADTIKLEKGFFEKVDNVPKFYEWLGEQPTVDAEPVRHGHWIWKERKGIREAWYQCSECNAYDLREIDVTSHYCWACGAKMDGERREE